MSGTEGVTAEMFRAGIAEVKQCLVGISSELAEIKYSLQSIERNIGYLENYLCWGFLFLILVVAITGCVIASVNICHIYHDSKREKENSSYIRPEILARIDEAVASKVDEAIAKALTVKK